MGRVRTNPSDKPAGLSGASPHQVWMSGNLFLRFLRLFAAIPYPSRSLRFLPAARSTPCYLETADARVSGSQNGCDSRGHPWPVAPRTDETFVRNRSDSAFGRCRTNNGSAPVEAIRSGGRGSRQR